MGKDLIYKNCEAIVRLGDRIKSLTFESQSSFLLNKNLKSFIFTSSIPRKFNCHDSATRDDKYKHELRIVRYWQKESQSVANRWIKISRQSLLDLFNQPKDYHGRGLFTSPNNTWNWIKENHVEAGSKRR